MRHHSSAKRIRLLALLLSATCFDCLAVVPSDSYTLTTFSDEFNAAALDTNTWGIYSNRTNVTLSGGQLHLNTVALGTDWSAASNWHTGGIRSQNFQQKFGYFETRMQIGGADGLNNAFWLNTPIPMHNGNDRLEIDIIEAHFHEEAHFHVFDWAPVKKSSGSELNVNLNPPGFHTVGLEWATDGTLRWYLDGNVKQTMSASALNGYNTMLPLEVLLCTLVLPYGGNASEALVGTHMDADYVRVWQKPGWLGTVNGNWGSYTNWGVDGVPGGGDAAVFNGTSANPTISLATDKPVKELYFGTANCAAYTFAAGYNLLLGKLASGTGWGGINVNSDVVNPQVINTAIIAQNPLVFANYSTAPGVSLDLNGNLTSASPNRLIHFAGAGRVNVAGTLSSQFGDLIRFNPGELWLTAANDFTGVAKVQDGTLVVTANGALGATGSSAYTVVSSGASLVFASNVNYTVTESVHLSGSGESGRQGALDLLDGTSVSFDGLITLDSNATIASGTSGGTLTLGGTVNTTASGSALAMRGSGTTIMNGPITGAGTLTKTGTGTLRINGPASHTGDTKVSEGTLDLAGSLNSSVSVNGGTLALGTTTGARSVNGSLTVDAAAILRIRIDGTTAGMQYDQLVLTGDTSNVVLAGTLDLVAAPGLAAGGSFSIIDNLGSAAVTGTFAGLPEGAEFYEDGQWWRISYTGGTGNDVVLTRITPTPTQAWQSTHFSTGANDPLISGDEADSDHDGISNLIERATAMDPNANDAVPAAAIKTATTLDFIYTKNKSATDLIYSIEWSDTLADDWSTAGVSAPTVVSGSDNGTTQQIKVTVPAGAGATKRFVHLKVTHP